MKAVHFRANLFIDAPLAGRGDNGKVVHYAGLAHGLRRAQVEEVFW
jgi:hypothetical protein